MTYTIDGASLAVRGLGKRYPGFELDDVSFSLDPGYIMGFIGRNGAGKTTTPKCVMGLVRPDAGTVAVLGQDFRANELALKAALIRHRLYDTDNVAGMNPNMAFFGLVLVMYAVFNAIFLPGSYKAAYRLLWPLLGGSLIAVAVGIALTTLPAVVGQLAAVNDRGLGNLPAQAAVLVAGVGVYAVTTVFACRWAAANFEGVDL